jgi:hypothetical protein
MLIGVDFSGPSNPARPPGEPLVGAAIVVPDRVREDLSLYVADCCERWQIDELHAVHLNQEQLIEVCAWLSFQDEIVWTAVLTDSAMFPAEGLASWREEQAEQLRKAAARTQEAELRVVLSNKDLDWHFKRLLPGFGSSLPAPQFIEYMFLLPRLIGDAVQACLDVFDGPGWGDEFEHVAISIDDSSNSAAKTQTRDLLKLMLAGPQLGLAPPATGGDQHPLFSKHRRDGRTGDLRSLIGDRIEFVDSKTEPLCQLADVLAWASRRHAANRSDPLGRDLIDKLRRRQHGIDGLRRIRPMYRRGAPESAATPYAHIAPLPAR